MESLWCCTSAACNTNCTSSRVGSFPPAMRNHRAGLRLPYVQLRSLTPPFCVAPLLPPSVLLLFAAAGAHGGSLLCNLATARPAKCCIIWASSAASRVPCLFLSNRIIVSGGGSKRVQRGISRRPAAEREELTGTHFAGLFHRGSLQKLAAAPRPAGAPCPFLH